MPIARKSQSPRVPIKGGRAGRSQASSRQADPVVAPREKKQSEKKAPRSEKAAEKDARGESSPDEIPLVDDDSASLGESDLSDEGSSMESGEEEEEGESEDSDDDVDIAGAASLARESAKGELVPLLGTSKKQLAVPAIPRLPTALADRVAAMRANSEATRSRKGSSKAAKEAKKVERVGVDADGRSRVVYIGRLPFGFFETQMRSFFEQFGAVPRLRLSRNKKTGRSKHFAFIEFENADTAEIVAESMHDYLLFRHRLQCFVVEPEKIHADIFKGANQHFERAPFRSINKRRHNKRRDAKAVKKITVRSVARETRKREKLADLGINYTFPGVRNAGASMAALAAADKAEAPGAAKASSPATKATASATKATPPATKATPPAKLHESRKSPSSSERKRKSGAASERTDKDSRRRRKS